MVVKETRTNREYLKQIIKELTEEQADAYTNINQALLAKARNIYHGITGSGKPRYICSRFKQRLITAEKRLCSPKLLTPQMAVRFKPVSDDVVVLHSALSR